MMRFDRRTLGHLLGLPLLTAMAPAPAGAAAPRPGDSDHKSTEEFPEAWHGRWRGQVEVAGSPNGTAFTMELVIASTPDPDRFSWTIVYDGAAGRQERRYLLLVKSPDRGEYAIDEQNGIVLPARLLGGVLYSNFTLGKSRIIARYERVVPGDAPDRLLVELVTFDESMSTTTGGGNVPAVQGWLAQSRQQAELRRVADPPGTPR